MNKIQNDFPVLKNNKNLVYLDSTATNLKPQCVLNAMNEYYQVYTSNSGRGLYPNAIRTTEEIEKVRDVVSHFINAKRREEIIFTHGTTDSLNLVAYAWGRVNIGKGDEIVTTIMEHHSNFVPWQKLAGENGAVLKIIDITDNGSLNIFTDGKLGNWEIGKLDIISLKTKIVAITHGSNVLGTINSLKEIISEIKKINPNCVVVVDGAQAVGHTSVDVQDLGCDFYAFSGHKILGPTGVGVLWGKYELLEQMPPFEYGGGMIERVGVSETTVKPPPDKFEAGTPAIAEIIGLGKAIEYIQKIGINTIRTHEIEMSSYAIKKLTKAGCKVYGPKDSKIRNSTISFSVFDKKGKEIHPHDVGEILARENICVRVGHHCAMPLHTRLGVPATVRASFHIYNTKEDFDRLIIGLEKVRKIFG